MISKDYFPAVSDYYSDFADHKNEMNNSRPDWLTTENHPTYNDHAMTGVGYEEYYDYSYPGWRRNVIVHDTYSGTQDVWVKWSSYFDHVIGIEM